MRYGKRKESEKITEEEVRKALERFKANGGLITKLPDEIKNPSRLVGAKYAACEYPSRE